MDYILYSIAYLRPPPLRFGLLDSFARSFSTSPLVQSFNSLVVLYAVHPSPHYAIASFGLVFSLYCLVPFRYSRYTPYTTLHSIGIKKILYYHLLYCRVLTKLTVV